MSSRSHRAGIAYAAAAYGVWGFLPLYIAATSPTGPVEFIGWRILMSVGFCAILLVVTRGAWSKLRTLARDRAALAMLAVAGLLVAANWLLYVIAVTSGRTLEGALGYFLNPLVSIVLALIFLRERLRPLQWGAVGLALVAVVVLAVGYGTFPWLSIGIAVSFGVYGLVKKRVGARVDALGGFFVETVALVPVAAGCIAWAWVLDGGITYGTVSPWHTAVLVLAGVVTSLPLLWFAAAAKRITLVEVGMMQFLAPILQFLIGVFLFREAMPLERWIGFAFVWAALVCFALDLARAGIRRRAEADVLGSVDTTGPIALPGPGIDEDPEGGDDGPARRLP